MKVSIANFMATHTRTGTARNAIFSERKALMEEIYATGEPIYCDESYYARESEMQLVVKAGDHFKTDSRNNLESWRDCHYYVQYADAAGKKAWVLTGGRYD